MEAGIELESELNLAPGLNISGSVRKSVLTNLTKNKRRSNSVLPRVHSDWPLYDFAGQGGHIHEFVLSYSKNLAPGLYGKLRAGLLEPFFAGIGGEILYKPAKSPLAIGLDISEVQQRDFDMRFDLRDYQTTVGHISFYYDAGGILDVEINAANTLLAIGAQRQPFQENLAVDGKLEATQHLQMFRLIPLVKDLLIKQFMLAYR